MNHDKTGLTYYTFKNFRVVEVHVHFRNRHCKAPKQTAACCATMLARDVNPYALVQWARTT